MDRLNTSTIELKTKQKLLDKEREKLEMTIIETSDTTCVTDFLLHCFDLATVPKQLITPLNKCLENGKIQDYCKFFLMCSNQRKVSKTTSSLNANPDASDGSLVSIPDNFILVKDSNGSYGVVGIRPEFGNPSKDRPCTTDEISRAHEMGLNVE